MIRKRIRPYRSALSVCALLTATSCNAPEINADPCQSFPKNLVTANNTDVSAEEIEQSEAIKSAMAKVQECYASSVYFRDGHPLIFERASLGSDKRIYVFYSYQGILDDMVVFRIGSAQEIDAAFSYSPLSRFAVPDKLS